MLKKTEMTKALGMLVFAGSTLMMTGCLSSDSNDSTPPASALPLPPPATSIDVNSLEQTVAEFIYALEAKKQTSEQLEDVVWESVFEEDSETDFPKVGSASGDCQAGGNFSRNVTRTGTNPINFSLNAEMTQCRHTGNGWAFTGSFSAGGTFTESATEERFAGEENIKITALSNNNYQLSSFERKIRFNSVESEVRDEEKESGYYVLTGAANIVYQLGNYEKEYISNAGKTTSFDFSVVGEGVNNYTLKVEGQNDNRFSLKAGSDTLELLRRNNGYQVTLNGESCSQDVSIAQAVSRIVSSSDFSLSCPQ